MAASAFFSPPCAIVLHVFYCRASSLSSFSEFMFLYKDAMTLMLTKDGMAVSKAPCEDRIADPRDRRTLLMQQVILGCISIISEQ